ncbi:hypothetical protein FACS189485_08420 [Spirochaetia bacterium]|nr:hypothetical protein FACS189485_08420 [Spirochaetia bacterium]
MTDKNWTWIRSADDLRRDMEKPEGAKAWAEIKTNADWWRANFRDSVENSSGWAHDFVCPACSAQLIFDRTAMTERFTCPDCGAKVESTRLLREAWVYWYRSFLADGLIDAAIVALVLNDSTYRSFIINTVMWYADHYTDFDEHGINAGRGKIMGQSLDEAVWGHNLMKALDISGFNPQSAEGQTMFRKLFLPMARLVQAQSHDIHNIPLWHVSYAAAVGIFFDDSRLYNQAMDGVLGVRNQILKGFTEDNFWHENSMGYHFYSLLAALYLFAHMKEQKMDLEGEQKIFDRICKSYLSILQLAFRDEGLIGFNDGGKILHGIRNFQDRYIMAARIFPEAAAQFAQPCRSGLLEGNVRFSWLYGNPAAADLSPVEYNTVHLPANCLAVLRTPEIEVFTKYGNICLSHAHPDALQICISPFALDPGSSWYGASLLKWYRSTAAHNTFTVDGKNQNSGARGTAELTGTDTLDMHINDAYEGVTAARKLYVSKNTLLDTFTYKSSASHVVDLFFHSTGDFECDGNLVPAEALGQEDGHKFLEDIRRWNGSAFRCTWTIGKKQLTFNFESLPKDAGVYVAKTPDNPSIYKRTTIIVRTSGMNAAITAKYTVSS